MSASTEPAAGIILGVGPEVALADRERLGGGLPRQQAGVTPQHLLMTLLGDYWSDREERLPSKALVELLAEFGVSEPSARAALIRLTRRGLLLSSRRGRNTYYGIHPEAVPVVRETAKRIVMFGASDQRVWDGEWTIVAFSVPEARRELRHMIRMRLHWLGFATLYDGLWCSPWNEAQAALAILSELRVDSATVMRARIDERSGMQALAAWDLDALKRSYLEFEQEFSPILETAGQGGLTATEALVTRTRVMDSWRNFLSLEPDLPAELLPADWPRSRMRELFIRLYDDLAPVARARCQQIVSKHSSELGALVTVHAAIYFGV